MGVARIQFSCLTLAFLAICSLGSVRAQLAPGEPAGNQILYGAWSVVPATRPLPRLTRGDNKGWTLQTTASQSIYVVKCNANPIPGTTPYIFVRTSVALEQCLPF